jgi:Domain of unknown function (DUF5597)/Beta-galactosidase
MPAKRLRAIPLILLLCTTLGHAFQSPTIAKSPNGGQLLVNGKPYLILGGELGNSSAGTAGQADTILPRLAQLHLNTVLMPVAWEQIEPTEGTYDFTILDHWIDIARIQRMHLVLLWFGSWKNAFSNYAPAWVKQDTKRFPRAIAADGSQTEILSTLGPETLKADSRAFAALMQHLRERDESQQTVLMVQVENEAGFLGRGGRDRSSQANHLFQSPVPANLITKLNASRDHLSPELAAHFNPQGKTWPEVFGDSADEAFMAWNYARYINSVAETGKRAYPLPMYVNAQLPASAERPGEYPSGGPHPANLDIYSAIGSARATAPAIDLYSPDIYWPDFESWTQRYNLAGNPIFIPEARLEAAPYNALYAYGQARAFGFSPFAVDSLEPATDETHQPPLAETYAALDSLSDLILAAQPQDKTRALVLHATSPRSTQTIALGGYLFEATLSRTWPARTLATDDGAMLILQSSPNEFYILGSGLAVNFYRDPDTDDKTAGIASIEEVTRSNGTWATQRRLNGDQTNQGRQLLMDPHHTRIYRVVLYNTDPQH